MKDHEQTRLELALEGAARLLENSGIEHFSVLALSREIGFSESWVRQNMGNAEDIKRLLVADHFGWMRVQAHALRLGWEAYEMPWPWPWKELLRHLWAADGHYRRARHHRWMIVLARSYSDRESFRWLAAVHAAACSIVRGGAPAHLRRDTRSVLAAIDAATGRLFFSAYRKDWRPIEQRREAYIASMAILLEP